MKQTATPKISGNPYIAKLIELMEAPQPKIVSLETYVDFCNFLDKCVQAGLPDMQGWTLTSDENGHVRYFGDHYHDYEFVWEARAIFNDFIDRVNREYAATYQL